MDDGHEVGDARESDHEARPAAARSSRASQFSEPVRRRALLVLLISTFFAWGGFFMVIPLLSVHFVDGLGWPAAAIGIVLAVRQFTQQGLATVAGVVADRTGAKPPILFGQVLRACGFAAMGFADAFWPLLIFAFISALGGAFFESPRAAAIAALTEPEERPRFYSLVGVFGGVGTAAGTQLGALLVRQDFRYVSIAAGIGYLVVMVMLWIYLPPVRVADDAGGMLSGVGLALRDRLFMQYTGLMAGHNFLAAQFYIAMPLVAVSVLGSTMALTLVYGVNSVVSVVLAYPLPRLVARVLAPAPAILMGNLVTAAGLAGIGLSIYFGPVMLLVGVFVFACGLVIVRPNDGTVQASLANPVALGSYFGVAMLSLGVGGGIGNAASGWLYDTGQRQGMPFLPWAVCLVIGLLTSIGLWLVMVRPNAENRRLRFPRWRWSFGTLWRNRR